MNGRTVQWLRGAAVLVAMANGGCTGGQATADARVPKAVRLVAVESSAGGASTTYSAVIAPNAQVDLAFRVPGYVLDLHTPQCPAGRTPPLQPAPPLPT